MGAMITLFLLISCDQRQRDIDDKSHKDTLIEVAKRVYVRELVSGTGGDISVRVSGTDRFIIKVTGTCIGDLTYDKIVEMNINGDVLEKDKKPSHEAEIHSKIYSMRENIGAIMHMHSPFATAWASTGKLIPAITQQSYKLLKSIAIVPYYAVGSAKLVDSIIQGYQNPQTQVVLMENHGIFVVGKDLYDLLYKAEVVENTARIAFYCNCLGTPTPFEFGEY